MAISFRVQRNLVNLLFNLYLFRIKCFSCFSIFVWLKSRLTKNALYNQQKNIYQNIVIWLFFEKLQQKNCGFIVTTLIFLSTSLSRHYDQLLTINCHSALPLPDHYCPPIISHHIHRPLGLRVAIECWPPLLTPPSLSSHHLHSCLSTIVGNFWCIQKLENYIF